jgi:hypothetical protein
MKRKKDPKVGTGKKPKGSDRRLYTDENPKDTVPIAYATQKDARDTADNIKKLDGYIFYILHYGFANSYWANHFLLQLENN